MPYNQRHSKTELDQLILTTRPWTASSFGRTAEIDAYNPTTKSWETIAVVNAVADIDAEDLANFIAQKVNQISPASDA
jgi:hypothetical protein